MKGWCNAKIVNNNNNNNNNNLFLQMRIYKISQCS